MRTHSNSFESVIRGHHVFKTIWSSFVGETLAVKQEKGNRHDYFALAVIRRQTWPAALTMIVGRIHGSFPEFASHLHSYKCLLTMNIIIARETLRIIEDLDNRSLDNQGSTVCTHMHMHTHARTRTHRL